MYSPNAAKIAFTKLSDDLSTYQIAIADSSDGSGETILASGTAIMKGTTSWGRAPVFNFRVHIDPSLIKPTYPTVVSGTFTDKGGDLVPSASLTLWQRPEGTKNYTQMQGQSATTARDGTFTFGKLYPKESTYYQVRYSGSEERDIPPLYSGAKEVVVK